MTRITFDLEGERIVGFQVCGHSGYAQEGEDIVCAAVSSAVRLVNTTVNEVLRLSASVKVRGGEVSFHLPGGLSETDKSTCQNLLAGMMVYLSDLHQEYPSFVEVEADDPAEIEEAEE
jgi:uncharacterized protein YsxB (DUF464 family)